MSVRVMSMVFDARGLSASEKILMLALADHASDDGKSVYPGIKRLMANTALSERTVQATLRKLEGRNIIYPVGVSEHQTTAYEIHIVNLAKLGGAKIAPPRKSRAQGVQNLQEGGATVAPNTSLTIIKPSKNLAPEKPGDPRKNAPQIVAWREATERYPSKIQWDYIIQHLPADTDKGILARVWKDWQAKGYNPRNVAGIIECYQRGSVNGNGAHHSNRPASKTAGNAVSEEGLAFARSLSGGSG